jgi:fatty-acyl-CoA synthase
VNLAMLIEMAAEGAGDRVAFGSVEGGTTYAELLALSRATAAWLSDDEKAAHVGLLDQNSLAVPLLLFGAGMLGRPFAPINYRLTPTQLDAVLSRLAPAVVVTAPGVGLPDGGPDGIHGADRDDFLATVRARVASGTWSADPDEIAVLLFTSGTTGEPKAAVLRHRHLVSYIISTVEFLGAGPDEAALVSVPPYHVAGISAILSSVYAGRRVVQLESFDAEAWVALARTEAVTHAMVVPTMLGRILDVIAHDGLGLPALRHLSYGGGRMPLPVIEAALDLLPHVNFVNAYGLTETSSTIAVLGPDDHRLAVGSHDPAVRRRLASVGRPLPSLELEVRDPDGRVVGVGESGEIHVRGEQIAGEYLGGRGLDPGGWFATRDAGFVDHAGYLFVEGRLDDVIVRGGENLSPGEIEAAIVAHPAVAEVGVVGVPDTEWGEQVAAVVVLAEGRTASSAELKDWVRSRLRSSRTPSRIVFVESLPYTETGKLLRRNLRTDLLAPATPTS